MEKLIDWILTTIKTRPGIAVVVGAAVTIAIWIASPLLMPYTRIAGSTALISLRCVPREVQLRGNGSNAAAPAGVLAILGKQSGKRTERGLPLTLVNDRESGFFRFQLANADLNAAKNQLNSFDDLNMTAQINFPRASYVELQQISIEFQEGPCAKVDVSGSQLLGILKNKEARLVRVRLIQEDLSSLIYKFNSVLGNALIGVLLVASLWLIYDLVEAIRSARRPLESNTGSAVSQFFDKSRTLGLWRAIGPGIGFMLTVSSLVEVLHPNAQNNGDTYTFVAGIQIAVVSTFLGLFIRVIAEIDMSIRERTTLNIAARMEEQDADST